MKKNLLIFVVASVSLLAFCFTAYAETAQSVTQYGITWTFDKPYPVGQFVSGDWWVVGPVKITAITNTLNPEGYEVEPGLNGSMVNPPFNEKTGYDVRAKWHYDPSVNASLPNGKPLAPDNLLLLAPDSSLVSSVSWIWKDGKPVEEHSPRVWDDKIDGPVYAAKAQAILTVLAAPPPEGTFRPGFCGTEKKLYNIKDIKWDKLQNLPPIPELTYDPAAETPVLGTIGPLHGKVNIKLLTEATQRPWIDHVYDWKSNSLWATYNFPGNGYGRTVGNLIGTAILALNMDWTKLEGTRDEGRGMKEESAVANGQSETAPATVSFIPPPSSLKKDLLVNLVQRGIDYAAIAKVGGGWPLNGGIFGGRKAPILFAGVMLDDPDMKSVGTWKTQFHDDDGVFYVSQKEVDMTRSDQWKPDKRGGHLVPYTEEMIGMPEWGFRPTAVNAAWGKNPYRSVNVVVIPPLALAMLVMDARALYNREVYFDYADRVMSDPKYHTGMANITTAFTNSAWAAYRSKYPTNYDPAKWDKFFFDDGGGDKAPPTPEQQEHIKQNRR